MLHSYEGASLFIYLFVGFYSLWPIHGELVGVKMAYSRFYVEKTSAISKRLSLLPGLVQPIKSPGAIDFKRSNETNLNSFFLFYVLAEPFIIVGYVRFGSKFQGKLFVV